MLRNGAITIKGTLGKASSRLAWGDPENPDSYRLSCTNAAGQTMEPSVLLASELFKFMAEAAKLKG